MRNVIFPLAVVSSAFLAACSFSLRAGGGTQSPNNPPNAPAPSAAPVTAAPPTAAPAPAKPVATGPIRQVGRRPAALPSAAPSTSASVPAPPVPAPAPSPTASSGIVTAATVFGGPSVDATSFKGTLYWVEKTTSKVPSFAELKPAGVLFANELNVAAQPFSSGFPGVDAARTDYFAIRYEAPLLITNDADYTFRLIADDGAVLRIDGTPIIDNDGVKPAPDSKDGPVHLVAGTHLVQVDYLQTSGPVALQLLWRKASDKDVAVFRPGTGSSLNGAAR